MISQKRLISSPLTIQPVFSKKLAFLIAITHGGALIGIWFAALDFEIKIVLSLWVLMVTFFNINKHLFFNYRHLTRSMTLIDDYIVLPNDLTAIILPHVYVHPLVVVLPLKLSNKKYETLVLFEDSLDKTTFHYLRVRLLHPLQKT
jgi:hypothetical protein